MSEENLQILAMVLGTCLAISESLALIPALKSNSILQLVTSFLKKVLSLFKKKPEEKPEA